ncbi:MAG: histidinol-phosphate transaminase [Dehalococcoidales bacterium]|nr:histidinol-phosphate transaminase [Dehalococcoidales bacterium]
MLQPKSNIDRLVPATHGGIDYAELGEAGISPEDVLDFSVSTNPFGPPPGVKETLSQASIDRYPDSDSIELRRSLARKLGLPPNQLLIGSGSTELIRLVVTAYFGIGDLVMVPQPTYGEYEIACHLADARVLKQPSVGTADLRLNVPQIVEIIRKQRPKGIFLCNPNNPTGQYLSREEVERIVTADSDCLVILDEVYIGFTDSAWSSIDLVGKGNLVVLRSMTKDYALAGLRLGYAIAAESIMSVLNKVKPPWNVSSVAQAAGIAVLKVDGYLDACAMTLKESKEFLVKELRRLGCSPLPSEANFFLVEVRDAASLRQALFKKGILVRDCSSFGLRDYIRLAPRTMPECQKLVGVLEETGVYQYVR